MRTMDTRMRITGVLFGILAYTHVKVLAKLDHSRWRTQVYSLGGL